MFTLPTFVWCLFTGVVIRNSLTHLFKFNVADSAIDVLGNVALSLFLAIALMSLKLWQLAGLALPVMVDSLRSSGINGSLCNLCYIPHDGK